jgi:simple sugar transport system permease protein
MQGGSHLDLTTYCPEVSDMISAIIIYLCGFVGFMKYVMNKRRDTKKGGEE